MFNTEEFIGKNANTFAGHYGVIIQRYKRIRPEAKFFLVNFPRAQQDNPDHEKAAMAHDGFLYRLYHQTQFCGLPHRRSARHRIRSSRRQRKNIM